MSSEPHRVFYEPMRNLPIDPVRNPIEPIRKKVDTNWCQRRMYIMDQSFPNPQINSITRDSDIFHWFQFLKLTDQEKNSQVQKIEKLSKMLFFAMFTGFCCKTLLQKGLRMRHCVHFVAYSYPVC